MNDEPGPALRKRQLAQELAALRAAAGLDTNAVAKALRCDRSQISHYEGGRRTPDYARLVVMLQIYGASDRLEYLTELLDQANERGWWDVSGLPAWARGYIGLESDASCVQAFALEQVPSLLQSRAYAEEVLRRHHAGEDSLARDVTVRMRRQERVGRDLSLDVVVSQGLVERLRHMGSVGEEQLGYLVAASTTAGTELRVLPFAAGMHRSGSGSFTLLDFPDRLAGAVGYVMYALGSHLVDDPEVVQRLRDLYLELKEQTLSVQASREMLAAVKWEES